MSACHYNIKRRDNGQHDKDCLFFTPNGSVESGIIDSLEITLINTQISISKLFFF